MNKPSSLLKELQQLDFALQEIALFLDVHPDNKTAMDCYRSLSKLRDIKARQVIREVGPLTLRDNHGHCWEWICDPWPWEREG